MEINEKKWTKKTNVVQFQKLVELMEEHPRVATGNPSFGSTKMAVEEIWNKIATNLNALGPPLRNGAEWKRVWQDQKCRVKKKISENTKSLHGTGGGPCTVSNLTHLEEHIDRICHLSSAAAPSGTVLGHYYTNKIIVITPPRRQTKTAVVTPTTSKKTQPENTSNIFTPTICNATTQNLYTSPITTTQFLHQSPLSQQTITATISTTDKVRRRIHNRKTKNVQKNSDRMKLLLQQNEMQVKTLDIMAKHAEAAKMQAEAAKLQAEAANVQAEAAKVQAQALQQISEASQTMAKSLISIVKHLKDEE